MDLPNHIYSGAYREGHVQGIAVDQKRGYVYYSFTTLLLKTDLSGKPVGSVVKLAGHLGCITYDAERDCVYGALELKHDVIGAGIIDRIGYDATCEDAFYLVAFDCAAITRENMDAESDGVMRAVYLKDVSRDYAATDEASGKPHRYGCSGIDGTGLGPVFGADKNSKPKIMVAYGVYGDVEREDNDYQVIMEYDRSIIDEYALPLCQSSPHHNGPETADNKYFFYTGNTTYGIQNLEYDAHTQTWLTAVYAGKKPGYDNFNMFFIDGTVPARFEALIGRKGETGKVLTAAQLGVQGKQARIRGSFFPYGQTGVAALGEGKYYFSQHGGVSRGEQYTDVYKYELSPDCEHTFVKVED